MAREEFAPIVGVSVSTLARYERGDRSPGADFVATLKEHFGVDPSWFITGRGDPHQGAGARHSGRSEVDLDHQMTGPAAEAHPLQLIMPRWKGPDPNQFDFVPMAEAHVSTDGKDFVLTEGRGDYYAFRKDWLRQIVSDIQKVVLMVMRSPSMAPTILDGDVVMIDGGRRRIHDGCVYALGIEESITIKRLEILPLHRIRIISDNRSEYPPYEARLESIRVFGQVVWYARTMAKQGE